MRTVRFISPRAVTLLEMLMITMFISVAGVGIAAVVSHSLRMIERARLRTELSLVAYSEVERRRAAIAQGQEGLPSQVRIAREQGLRITTVHEPSPTAGLVQVTVTVRALKAEPMLDVSMSGWVSSRDGSS